MAQDAAAALEAVYRSDWGRIVATLIRLVGDFDTAEEAAQEAFAAAVDQWRAHGVPEFPRAWIIQAARHKAIDRLRRRTRFEAPLDDEIAARTSQPAEADTFDPREIPDDPLRLIFTCCHPALALDSQVALTLRTLGGLDTAGEVVLLEDQDRRRWDQAQIAEALPLVEDALRGGAGPFALQAAIAALHCQAAKAEETDWLQIVRLYDVLATIQPTPVVALNRAVA